MENIKDVLKPVLWILGLLILGVLAFSAFRDQVESAASQLDPTAPAPAETEDPAVAVEPAVTPTERSYRIVTLLPFDAIPAIDDPRFYSAAEADTEYEEDELVLGVTINGESKAYSTSHLDSHEIVNDTLGGRKIAVTW
jgi:hypothetical protein